MVMPVRGFSETATVAVFPATFAVTVDLRRGQRHAATPLNLCSRLGPTAYHIRREADGDTRDGCQWRFRAPKSPTSTGCAERLRRCRQHHVIDRRAPDQQILDLSRRPSE